MPTRSVDTPARPGVSPSGEEPAASRGNFSRDFLASLVVFLVAAPLGLGIALASGAPLISGLIACAVGGIVAGLLAGAPLQISGPAAGLTVLVYGIIQKLGWEVTLAAVVAAGLLQILFGVLRVSRICLAITPAVVKGMLAGIGVVIALAQLHVLLGGQPQSSAFLNLRDLPGQIANLHGHAAILGVLTLGLLFAWGYMPKRVQSVPGPLVAVLFATVVSNVFWFDVARVELPKNLFSINGPALPADWGAFAVAAVSLALVASVESLLCAVATDKLHSGPRAKLDRELVAQGVGNTVSGLVGGLPITGVIVRSSANIEAGARTRVSAILHGIWIILFVFLLGSIVERIPLAALAGLLVYVGVKLVNREHIRELKSHGEEFIYGATLLGVVFIGLLQGVALGVALSVALLLLRLAKAHVVVEERAGRWHVRIDGSLTFLAVPDLASALGRIPAGTAVDIDLAVDFMDHAGFEALHSWRLTHEKLGGRVDIDELHEVWYGSAAEGKPRVVKEVGSNSFGLRNLFHPEGIQCIADLARGVVHFRRRAKETIRPLFRKLAREGQSPNVLFITCGDSRIVPNYITATKPGDLFVIRNIGNLVPSCCSGDGHGHHGPHDDSVAAALEFSLNALKIKNIVVCGHSECGAMKAVAAESKFGETSSLQAWLKHAASSRERFCRSGGDPSAHGAHNDLAKTNVVQQLENLRAYPDIRAREAAGELHLFGWYFDIESADVFMYVPEGEWVQVDEGMADKLLSGHQQEEKVASLEPLTSTSPQTALSPA